MAGMNRVETGTSSVWDKSSWLFIVGWMTGMMTIKTTLASITKIKFILVSALGHV